jgi:hypothetical protein
MAVQKIAITRMQITIAIWIVLVAVGIAYSKGWFDRSSTGREIERGSTDTQQVVDKE